MEARLSLKSYNLNLKHKCLKCVEIKEQKAAFKDRIELQSVHCHCSMFTVSDGMIADMSGGQPSRRYKADLKANRDKLLIERTLLRDRFHNSARDFKTHMKTELGRYRKSLQKNIRQPPSHDMRIQSEAEKKAERIKRKEEIENERRNKRARLDLLF